ncbi:MAG: glycosyltransferase family 4 protein [Thermodesulfobacteriota bacterium]
MKILMIAPQPFFEPRGTPFSVLGRLRALSELGHQVDLLTYHVGSDVAIPGIRIFRTPRIRFIKEIPVGFSWVKVFLDILVFVKAFSMNLLKRYDLIHTHEEASVFGVVLARIFRVPHLYDFHNSIPQAMLNCGYRGISQLVPFLEWIERRVIHASDAVITISPALEDYIRQIDDQVPLMMIENIVEEIAPRYNPEEDFRTLEFPDSLLDGKKVILYTGTFEPYQGLDLLIESAVHVLSHRKDVMFLLVGGKSDQVQHYQNQVREVGLSSHFFFTGIRPPAEIPILMNIANALVSPRVRGIGTPLKVYAYLQSGKPIVATNCQAHSQVLNTEVAVLVDPNPEAMAQGIISVLENPSFAERIGEQARRHFENQYNFRAFVEKTEKILKMALR